MDTRSNQPTTNQEDAVKTIKRRSGCVFTQEGHDTILSWNGLSIVSNGHGLSTEQMYAELERLIEDHCLSTDDL